MLRSSTTAVPWEAKLRIRSCSMEDIFFVTSAMRIAQSTSSTLCRMDFTMCSESLVLGLCIPGVSMKTYCVSPLVSTPFMRFRVV